MLKHKSREKKVRKVDKKRYVKEKRNILTSFDCDLTKSLAASRVVTTTINPRITHHKNYIIIGVHEGDTPLRHKINFSYKKGSTLQNPLVSSLTSAVTLLCLLGHHSSYNLSVWNWLPVAENGP